MYLSLQTHQFPDWETQTEAGANTWVTAFWWPGDPASNHRLWPEHHRNGDAYLIDTPRGLTHI